MSAGDEKRSSGNSQERLTRPPDDEQRAEIVSEKPTQQAQEPIPPIQRGNGGPKSASELDPSLSVSARITQTRELYTNWQFLTVFVVSYKPSRTV